MTRGRLLRAISVSQALSWFAGVGTLAVNRASPHGRDEISPRRAGVKFSSIGGRLLAHKIGGFIYCGDPRKLAPSIFFPINGPARQIRYSLGLSLASANCARIIPQQRLSSATSIIEAASTAVGKARHEVCFEVGCDNRKSENSCRCY